MAEKPELSEAEYRRRTRRSLIVGGVAGLAGYRGWRWIQDQPEVDNIPQVLRKGDELNESIWSTVFRDDHQARTFSRGSASILRFNGTIGIRDELDLRVLPHHEMTIEHKCIEGWVQITNWGGARFADFMAGYTDRLPDDISHG